MKKILSIVLCAILLFSLSGCAAIESKINDIRGKLVGNNYDVIHMTTLAILSYRRAGKRLIFLLTKQRPPVMTAKVP